MYVTAAKLICVCCNIFTSRIVWTASHVEEAFLPRGLKGLEWVREGALGVL